MSHSLSPARICFVLAATLLALCTPALAQHDTRGKMFWVTFMSNEGSSDLESDMRLYLSSETPTTARVIYFGGPDTIVVPLPQARTTVEVDISSIFGTDVELYDYQNPMSVWQEISSKAIQVIADEEITCYGVNIRTRSSDAFLSLPDDVLTNAYIVLAYPNGRLDAMWGGGYDKPSQFAIIGTEDGTTVRIAPAAELFGRRKEVFTITLDRGEVFNGQALVDMYQDVSGTEIRSNKPVAVYAGNRRTSVPLRVGNFRDHLVEQMPPLEVWGREAVVTPHYLITPSVPDTAVVRILAAFDNTRWWIDGVEQAPLQRAVSFEIPLTRAMHLTADNPILVAQYEHSAAYNELNEPQLGDPFMMLVPPPEQFFNEYVFQSVSHFEFMDWAHFVNVVIPTSSIPSLRLDDAPVPLALWMQTPKPGYSFAQIDLTPGSHKIVADSSFGISVYGYGIANSYGYTGGMLFRTLVHDFEPPEITPTLVCQGVEGIAYDSRITDTGVDSLYQLPASVNVSVTIDPFVPGADTVAYHARLVDPYSDGVVSMKVVDSSGRSRIQTNPIPGFTVRAVGMSGGAPVVLDTLRLVTNLDTCVTLMLENTGRFPQTVTALSLSPQIPSARFTTPLPLTIQAGSSAPITVCVQSMADSIAVATIAISGECVARDVAMLPIVSGVDTIPPSIGGTDPGCSRPIILSVDDTRGRPSLVAAVDLDTLINGRIVGRSPEQLPAASAEVRLEPIDQYYDLIYQVRVRDLAGNVAVFRDTIGGLTITALDRAGDSVSLRFDRTLDVDPLKPSQERCDSVLLVNYGARTLHLASARFSGNRIYSIPPAQLPLEIPPHSQRRIAVCVEADAPGLAVDTLVLTDACGREDRVALKGVVAPLTTEDRCNNALRVTSLGPAKRTFLSTPHPNPSSGATASVDVGLPIDGPISLELIDANGAPAALVLRNVDMGAGVHRVDFDISSLDNGVYFCRLATARGEALVEKLVVRR